MRIIPTAALLAAILSAVSWIYRYVVEYTRLEDLPFYVLVPLICWALFAGPLFMLRSKRRIVRVLAGTLLVPFSLLWGVSILVGFYGLRIH